VVVVVVVVEIAVLERDARVRGESRDGSVRRILACCRPVNTRRSRGGGLCPGEVVLWGN
jgi:hypothetical protein